MSPPSDAMVGADATELEAGAEALRRAAARIDRDAVALSTTLTAIAWFGDGADDVRDRWRRVHRHRLAVAADALRVAAVALDRNAAEQQSASDVAGAAGVPPVVVGPPHRGGGAAPDVGASDPEPPDRLTRLGDVLDSFGAARDDLEAIADLADDLDRLGVVDPLIDLLTDPGLRDVITAADHVLDVGALVVDVLTDAAEHPELALDERIIHAVADAGIRFAIDEGGEQAIAYLSAAVVASFGVSAVAAPFVQVVVAELLDEVVTPLVDRVDDATDLVEHGADLVVDAYRVVEQHIGPLIDAAERAVEVVGDAAELVGDGADRAVAAGQDAYVWADHQLDAIHDAAADLVDESGELLMQGAGAVAGTVTDGVGALVDGAGSGLGAAADAFGGWFG